MKLILARAFAGIYFSAPILWMVLCVRYRELFELLPSIPMLLMLFSFVYILIPLIFPRLCGSMLARVVRCVPGEEIVTKSYNIRIMCLLMLSVAMATVSIFDMVYVGYVDNVDYLGLGLVAFLGLLPWLWGGWALLSSPELGVTYFHVRKDSFSVKSFNDYVLVPGTAGLSENDNLLFSKGFKIRGVWRVKKFSLLFFKDYNSKDRVITQYINSNIYGSEGPEVIVDLIRSGNLLSHE